MKCRWLKTLLVIQELAQFLWRKTFFEIDYLAEKFNSKDLSFHINLDTIWVDLQAIRIELHFILLIELWKEAQRIFKFLLPKTHKRMIAGNY